MKDRADTHVSIRNTTQGKNLIRIIFSLIFLTISILLSGCTKGEPFENEPIHIVPDMDYQPKYEAQEASEFFVDGASGRLPVEGTVARGTLEHNQPYYTGMVTGTEDYIETIPVEMTEEDLARGKERYEIYCTMCHGEYGVGDGIVIDKGMIEPPSYHDENVMAFPDGQIFHTISEGARNMQSYKQQIPVEDHWKIVHYVRHLQKSGVKGDTTK